MEGVGVLLSNRRLYHVYNHPVNLVQSSAGVSAESAYVFCRRPRNGKPLVQLQQTGTAPNVHLARCTPLSQSVEPGVIEIDSTA